MDSLTITPTERFKWYTRQRSRILTRAEQVLIIEMFIYHNISIVNLAKQEGLTTARVSRIVSLYFKKPEHGLSIMSKI